MIAAIELLFMLLLAYLATGLLCSVALHGAGLRRIDPATIGAGWWFRLLITPGLVALWPLMIARWRRAVRSGKPAPGEVHRPLNASGLRRVHGRLAMALLLIAPLLLALAVYFRPARPDRTAIPPLATDSPAIREPIGEFSKNGL